VTKEHLTVKARYGGLYLQYEPEYWVSDGGGGVFCTVLLSFSHLFFSFLFTCSGLKWW
jgi:hypothetical protein